MAAMLGQSLPQRMGVSDMCEAFGLKRKRFYQLVSAGQFDPFELRPRIGKRAWSGALVRRYLDGEPIAPKQHARFTKTA